MGKPKVEYVETSQKQELDPIAQAYFWSGQLPREKLASLRRINAQVYGAAPNTFSPLESMLSAISGRSGRSDNPDLYKMSPEEERRQEAAMMDAMYGPVQGPNQPRGGGGGGGFGDAFSSVTGGYESFGDMFDGGGPGRSGDTFQGGGRMSDIANAVTGRGPEASDGRATPSGGNNPSDLSMRSGGLYAQGGIVGLANGGMVPPTMGGRMPNLSNRDMAYQMAMQAMQPRGYAMGGYVEGPGTGTSDDIPATIYQDGQPVQEAALSDGEFVMTERAVRGAGEGDPKAGAARMYEMMRRFERGGRVG